MTNGAFIPECREESELAILIRKLRPDAIIPRYIRRGDAGFDLHIVEDVIIPPGCAKILPTGIAVAIPYGYELQIRLRSGTALNTPLILPNAPATIDAGYRGELGIIARNLSSDPYTVKKGTRIAQGVVARVFRAVFTQVETLPHSERGDAGYGSSGSN